MKIAFAVLLALIPATLMAQNFQGMSQADMQKMIQGAPQMQTCMENIDQAEMKALEDRGNEVDAEINTLCAEGKRDQAQAKAIEFSREVAQSPALQQMRECGELAQGMMPEQMPLLDKDVDYSNRHVCDE